MRASPTLVASLLAPSLFVGSAAAQSLNIGVAAPITSLDPHFYNAAPNTSIAQHIFPFMTRRNARARLEADLIESWRAIDETTWEFKLRDARWTDGKPIVADDIAFTMARLPNVPNSPAASRAA